MSFPLGAHVSSAGGTPMAPPRARAIGATAMQLFTKQANRWAERECDDHECSAFRAALAETDVVATCAHDSYLINLASPDDALRERSRLSFEAELRRCRALGLDFLVSHPGNYMDERESGLARNAESIVAALEHEPGPTLLLLETTAGAGTVLGSTFEELAALIERIPEPHRSRVGVCLDTAHVFAAGYDLVNDYDGVMDRFGEIIGFDRLKVLHLNDVKGTLGSHRDRHAWIGDGELGLEPFRRIVSDPRLLGIPKLIETPKGKDPVAADRENLSRLRGLR